MAVLKCQHCEYVKEVSEKYAGRAVKCPQCGNAAKVHDMTLLLTAYSDTLLEFQTELKELKHTMAECGATPLAPVSIQISEEFTEAFHKVFRENRIAMTEFSDAMKLRDAITKRSERMSMYLMRFSFVGFFILLVIMLFLAWQFIDTSKEVSVQLTDINTHISTVSNDLINVKENLNTIDLNSAADQKTVESVDEIQNQISNLNQEISQTQAQLDSLSKKYNALVYGSYR